MVKQLRTNVVAWPYWITFIELDVCDKGEITLIDTNLNNAHRLKNYHEELVKWIG